MKNKDILSYTAHRPFELPDGPWIMKQVWEDLLFAHWPAREEELLPYLPPGLELELWEGRPWISISPFRVNPLRLRGFPPLPGIQRFLELNIRTYVTCCGKPGVYFFNLDASNLLAVIGARTWAHLPYSYSRMRIHYGNHGKIHYESIRGRSTQGEKAVFKGIYRPASPNFSHAKPGTLLHWVTERYCLYAANRKGQIYRGEIHHLPWPLHEAELEIEKNTTITALGLHHEQKPSLVTFTPHLEVLLWPIHKVKR